MAIHERLYSRLAAPPRSRSTFPALAISRYGTRYATRGVFRKLVLFASFAPAVIMSFGLYFVAQNEEAVLRFVARNGMGNYASMAEVPADKAYQSLSTVLWMLLLWQGWFATLLTPLVGAPQIADDMRSHAFEVYLARPISRWDYFLGKLLVIMRPLLLIMGLPVVIVLGMAHGFLEGTFASTWTLYPRAFAAILVWATVNSIVILGISSMGKSARYASVIWFVVTVGSFIVASILLQATQNSMFDLVSYNHCLFSVVINLIDLRPVVDLDVPILDIDRGPRSSLLVLGGLCLLSTWLVMRRLRAGRLP